MLPDAFFSVERNDNQVPGESTDPVIMAGLIEFLSFSLDFTQRERRPGPNVVAIPNQPPIFETHRMPLRILKPVDKSSPKLQDMANRGYNDLSLNLRVLHRTGDSSAQSNTWDREPYLKIDLEHAQVVSAVILADPRAFGPNWWPSEADLVGPLEEISFSYGEIAFGYGVGGTDNQFTWTHERYADE